MKPRPKSKPSRHPQTIHKDAWYYENRLSVEVLIDVRSPEGGYIATARARIPWHMLRKSMRRCTGAHV